jgi:hypothetical protein
MTWAPKNKVKAVRDVCGDCQHLGVTYEASQPWRCAKFGFKSRDLPARVVLRETGMECAYYSARVRIRPHG